nr:uncharacterized protein LOC116833807 [Chelonoidis abingdonii]
MPATLGPAGVKAPVHEQISELQNKIQLLEGDRKAFYESSQWTIKKNRESIQWLRQENKKLHKKLAAILAVSGPRGWQGAQSLWHDGSLQGVLQLPRSGRAAAPHSEASFRSRNVGGVLSSMSIAAWAVAWLKDAASCPATALLPFNILRPVAMATSCHTLPLAATARVGGADGKKSTRLDPASVPCSLYWLVHFGPHSKWRTKPRSFNNRQVLRGKGRYYPPHPQMPPVLGRGEHCTLTLASPNVAVLCLWSPRPSSAAPPSGGRIGMVISAGAEMLPGKHPTHTICPFPPPEGAIEVINHRLCEKINRLNHLKHQVEVRKRRLEELQLQYDSKVQEAWGSQAVEEGDAEAAKTLRRLENQLEKARLKVEEAEHVTGLYRQLKAHMQEESLTAQTQLDALEAEILRLHHELHGLQAMNTEAQATRDAARLRPGGRCWPVPTCSVPAQTRGLVLADEEASGDEGDVVTRAALKRQSQQLVEARTKRRSRPKKKEAKP